MAVNLARFKGVLSSEEVLLDSASGNTMVNRSGRSVSRLAVMGVTDLRVVVVVGGIVGQEVIDLDYSLLTSVDYRTTLLQNTITLNAPGKEIWFGGLKTGEAVRIGSLVRERIDLSALGGRAAPYSNQQGLNPTLVPAPPGTGPGWLADPTSHHEQRYWDGSRWTEHVFSSGEQSRDFL